MNQLHELVRSRMKLVALVALVGLVGLAAGCSLYRLDGDDVCLQAAAERSPPAPGLVDPLTLQCEDQGGGPVCDPRCELCPEAKLPAMPTWGSCASSCVALDESACSAAPQCRVARDWATYYRNPTDRPSFIGCYPLDTVGQPPTSCQPLGAQDCSRHADCTALYEPVMTNCATCAHHQFKECIPAAQLAGFCHDVMTCRAAPPVCPSGTTPGIENGCWTGSCIPDAFCPIGPLGT